MEMFKDVTIGEHKYQVGRFTARVGSWLLKQSSKGENLTEEEFANMQNHCLAVCKRYEPTPGVVMPIMAGLGVFAIKELEFDLKVVNKLQREAMSFNFDSFLADSVQEMKEALAEAAQPSESSNT